MIGRIVLFTTLALVPLGHAATRTEDPDALARRAAERLASPDPVERRHGLEDFEAALQLAPDRVELLLAAGRANLRLGYRRRALQCFERASQLAPREARAHAGIAETLRRAWIADLDSTTFARSIQAWRTALELDPRDATAWRRIVPLLYEAGDLRAAAAAAEQAWALAPDDPPVALLVAYLEYRAGHLAEADQRFEGVIPRLEGAIRDRLTDLHPVLSELEAEGYDDLQGPERLAFEDEFWKQLDPDPTTTVNEARLEFRARVAHVVALLEADGEFQWDLRCELYVRYGSPSEVRFQPVEAADEIQPNRFPPTIVDAHGVLREIAMAMRYPIRTMYWSRPELGIHAELQDKSLLGAWQLPTFAPDVQPDARAMARGDLLAASGGRALFRSIAPGLRSLAVAGQVHAFPGEPTPRLFAYVMAPGTPADTLTAECVVLDAGARELRRATRRLGASTCDPTRLRTAEFGFELPPGAYRVAIAVSDGRDGRGVLRRTERLESPSGPLRISDVVVVCRAPATPPVAGALTLDPDPLARGARGEPLSVYYEIHGLSTGSDGLARFEVSYSAQPVRGSDGAPGPRRSATFLDVRSEDEHAGTVRRQFVDLPVSRLADGGWRLEVRVRDRRTGAEATASGRFRMGGGIAER